MPEEVALESASYAEEDARTIIIDLVEIITCERVLLFRLAAQIDRFDRQAEIFSQVVGCACFPDPDITDEAQTRAVRNKWLEIVVAIFVGHRHIEIAISPEGLRRQRVFRQARQTAWVENSISDLRD